MEGLFEYDRAAGLLPQGQPCRQPALAPRRSPCGCGRARSTSSSGSSTCSPRARRCGGWSRATSRCRCCCGGRPAPARPRSPRSSAGRPTAQFVEVSAVAAGVKEVRAAIDAAPSASSACAGRETVLFVDEVHRFTKAQQDALLPGVENRWVTLVAATTENPFFSRHLAAAVAVAAAHPGAADRRRHPRRGAARADRRARARRRGQLDAEALEPPGPAGRRRRPTGADLPGGRRRGRRREASVEVDRRDRRDGGRPGRGPLRPPGRPALRRRSARSSSRSAGSDVDAALHYLARMIEAGEDPRFIARRLVILASEDIGLADPTALTTAVAAAEAVAVHRHARGADQAGPGRRSQLAAGAQVQRRDHGDRRGDRRRARRQDRRRSRRTCATRTTPAPKKLGHGKGYQYAHDDARRRRPSSSTRPTTAGGQGLLPADQPRRRGRLRERLAKRLRRADPRRPRGVGWPRCRDGGRRCARREGRRVSARGDRSGADVAAAACVLLVRSSASAAAQLGRTLDDAADDPQASEQSAPILDQASDRRRTSDRQPRARRRHHLQRADVSSNVAAADRVSPHPVGSPLIKVGRLQLRRRSADEEKREGLASPRSPRARGRAPRPPLPPRRAA